jgi:hypothetical protein
MREFGHVLLGIVTIAWIGIALAQRPLLTAAVLIVGGVLTYRYA